MFQVFVTRLRFHLVFMQSTCCHLELFQHFNERMGLVRQRIELSILTIHYRVLFLSCMVTPLKDHFPTLQTLRYIRY